MKKIERGRYGYVSFLKKRKLLITICLFAVSLLLIILGFVFGGKSRESIFTVIGIVSVLPAAKALVGYIVFHPYNTFPISEYDVLMEFDREEYALYDFIMTSTEKVMNIYALVPAKEKVFLLLGDENKYPEYTRSYVSKILKGKLLMKEVVVVKSAKELIEKAKEPLTNPDEEELMALNEIKYYMVM